MPVVRYFAIAGSALLVFLFVSDAYFGDESNSRFNGSLYESATYVPGWRKPPGWRSLASRATHLLPTMSGKCLRNSLPTKAGAQGVRP